MPKKPVARMGDTGSHGGVILSGSPTTQANGRPIAHVQDIYGCPVHGPNPIITGAPNIFGGAREIACVGSKTACGAIITQGSPDVFIDTPESPISINSKESNLQIDEQVRVNDNTGNPLVSVPYFIQNKGGIYKGSNISAPIYGINESATTDITNQSKPESPGGWVPINFNIYVVFDDVTERGFLVRKVFSFDQYVGSEKLNCFKKGLYPKAPNLNISAVEHVMGFNNSRYISASSAFPDGAPNITGKKLYIDIDKVVKAGGKIIDTEDLVKDLTKYKGMYPHTQTRVDQLINSIKNIEYEVLIEPPQGKPVPPEALWKESHLKTARSLGKTVRVVQVLGIGLTAYDLGNAAYISYQQNSITPIKNEAIKQAGGWGFSWLGFKLGGIVGAKVCAVTGMGAFVGGLVGGIIGGVLAERFGQEWLEDFISEN